MNIESYLKAKSILIEEHLDRLVPAENVLHSSLFQAARYSLLGGGKRLRPILSIAVAEMLGLSNIPYSVPCALEMIHTYSLIHDDLPCMDDDMMRRGKPTLHCTYNEGHAVLAGDYLLTRAFEVIAEDCLLTPEQKVSIISSLSKQAGGHGMIGGQVADLENMKRKIDYATLEKIHSMKTASLITAAIELGGLMGGAKAKELQALRAFGQAMGIAFQIIDDVIDIASPQDELGKDAGSDQDSGKITAASFLGLEEARKTARQLADRGKDALKSLQRDTSLMQNLAEALICRTR